MQKKLYYYVILQIAKYKIQVTIIYNVYQISI